MKDLPRDSNILEHILFVKSGDGYWLRDKNTGEMISVFEGLSLKDISPSRERLLAFDKNGDLQVVTIDGQVEAEFSLADFNISESDNIFSSWISDDTIYLETWRSGELSDGAGFKLAWIINPFTGEAQEIHQYPDLFTYDQVYWEPESRMLFNYELNRVAYPTDFTINLVDLTTGKTLLGQKETRDHGEFPAWSPDGTRFMFSTLVSDYAESKYQEDILLLNTDGQMGQVTNYSKVNEFVDIWEPSWSDDGQDIAFWVDTKKDSSSPNINTLAVLDTQSGQVTEYCVGGNEIGMAAPDWSSDGKYFSTYLYNKENEESYEIIVDTETKDIYNMKNKDDLHIRWWIK
jgi:hypothetical protein